MIIALDYDKTYTADEALWKAFIVMAKSMGHEIICITMRFAQSENIKIDGVKIYYTARKAKKKYADENGIAVDIWIDDKPAWLFEDALS